MAKQSLKKETTHFYSARVLYLQVLFCYSLADDSASTRHYKTPGTSVIWAMKYILCFL